MKYFKNIFFPISAGITAGMIVYGLFNVNFSDTKAIINLLLRSVVVGVITGFVLGLLNTRLKIELGKRKDKSKLDHS